MIRTLHHYLNELRFAFSQGFLLYLLFLYPFLVIMVVGIAFQNPQAAVAQIGIYSEDPALVQTMSQYKNFHLTRVGSAQEAENLVRRGNVPASFVVTRCGPYYERDISAGIEACDPQLYITIVQDPSRTSEIGFLKIIFDAALMEKMTISAHNITLVQETAAQISRDLPPMRRNVSLIRDNLQSKEDELDKIKSEIDLAEINRSIQGIDNLTEFFSITINQSNQTQMELDSLALKIENENSLALRDISELKNNELTAIESQINIGWRKREAYEAKLYNYQTKLDGLISRISSLQNVLNSALMYRPGDQNVILAINQVNTIQSELYNTRSDLVSAQSELGAIDFNAMLAKTGDAKYAASNTAQKIQAFSDTSLQRIQSAKAQLAVFSDQSQAIRDKLIENRQRLVGIYDSAERAQGRIDQINTEIGEAIDNSYAVQVRLVHSEDLINAFTSISPEDFTPPQISDRSIIQSNNQLLFNFPFLLLINIAMFSLLFPIVMTSKLGENGVEDRMRQQGHIVSYLVGRFLGLYTIVILQTMLFFVFASLLFGIINFSPEIMLQILTILVVVLPFTAMGFLLSRLISKVAIGVLVTLLLFIPMVFMSGKLLPFIFMDPIMKTLGSLQPFSVALNVLESAFFRCIGFECQVMDFLFGYAYCLLMAAGCLFFSALLWTSRTITWKTRWGCREKK